MCCCSSVVEHVIGNDGVRSSILLSSTIFPFDISAYFMGRCHSAESSILINTAIRLFPIFSLNNLLDIKPLKGSHVFI